MKPVKPVTWALLGIFSVYLAVVAASAYKEGSNIFVWMGHFSEVLKRPSLLRWTPYTVKCIVIVLLLCAFAVLLYRSDREKRRLGGEYGTAKWGAAETTGKLNDYLADLNEQAEAMFSRLVKQLSEKEGVTEALKAENQMLWVQRMNNIRSAAMEIVSSELIYC